MQVHVIMHNDRPVEVVIGSAERASSHAECLQGWYFMQQLKSDPSSKLDDYLMRNHWRAVTVEAISA